MDGGPSSPSQPRTAPPCRLASIIRGGHSRRGGLTWEELAGKWREGLPECDVAKMLALAQRLDEVEDVTEFLDAFRAKG